MEHKICGDKHFENGNYEEYFAEYTKYHNKLLTNESYNDYKKCRNKYEIYKEMQSILKIDKNDVYTTLKVKANATKRQITDTYNKLMLRYHPDRTKMKLSHDVTQKINHAYVILGDDTKRKEYDMMKSASPFYRSSNNNQNTHGNGHTIFRTMYANGYTNDYRYFTYNDKYNWHFSQGDLNIFDSMMYRNFYRYPQSSRLNRVQPRDRVYIKACAFVLFLIFLLIV